MTKLEHDLTRARKHLTELENDLPQYHSLLTESEADAHRLKGERASLDAQAQAKGRVQVAREMLETHQVDIQAARAEVVRLEAQERREQLLAKMHTAADTAKTHREAMDKAFENAAKAMHRATELLLREWRAESEARQEFAQVGTELVPHFNSISNPIWAGLSNEAQKQFLADRAALLDELRGRGVPLDYAGDGATGWHSSLDEYPKRELPRDELSLLLWQAFLLIAGPEGRQFARFVPKPRQFIQLR